MQAIFEKKEYFQLSGTRAKGFKGYMPMFHPHAELLHVIRGTIPLTVDGSTCLLGPGETAIVFPHLPHSYESAPEAEALILLFDPQQTVFDNTLLHQKPACFHTDAPQFYPLLDRAVEMLRRGRPKTAMAYVNAALGELLETLTLIPSQGPGGDMTVQLLAYCAEHFTEDITVSHLAQALYISESYVSKLFSRNLKCSLREYINGLRVHKAQKLLEHGDLSVGQIMAQCGFQNQSSFNRVFRQVCGISPRQYRNEVKSD